MVCGKGFFVDNRSDVKTLRHGDVVCVFDHRHGFSDSESFGGEAGEDVLFGVLCEGDKRLCLSDSLLFQQGEVATISVKDERVVVFDDFVELQGSCGVGLENFGVHVVRHVIDKMHGSAAAAHDEEMPHLGIVLLARRVTDDVDVVGRRHEIDHIAGDETVVAVGNECLVATLDRHDVIGRICAAQFLQGFVEDEGVLSHLDAE